MSRHITRARVRNAERHTPEPFEPLTIIRKIVAPNPDGGPLIVLGVQSRTTILADRTIREVWSKPWPQPDDLPEPPVT